MTVKRGFGHVEAIISFVIFIAFLVFAFVFFSPLQSGRTLKSTSDYAWREVADATEQPLEMYSVAIINSPLIPRLIAITISGTPSSWKATVEDKDGVPIIPVYTPVDGVVHFDRQANTFVRIKFAQDFAAGDSSIVGTTPLSLDTDYNISSSETKMIRFEHLFKELNVSYHSDYAGLKQQFNIPNRVQFGFSVRFADGFEIRASKAIPENAEVLSRADRVEIVRMPSGKLEYADVTVFVW